MSFKSLLSKSKLNHNSIQPQPNITLVGLDIEIILQTPPPPPATPTHPHTLNVSNISAVTELSLTKL